MRAWIAGLTNGTGRRCIEPLSVFAAMALGASVVGCAGETEPAPDVIAPDFAEGGQERLADSSLPYPAGPFGYAIGSVMPNYGFYGWVRPIDEFESGYVSYIELAEFYNPTADGTYPEGSLFPVGSPKPKALLVSMSAVWCPPCNDEANTILPARRLDYAPLGGEFFVNLADSDDPGIPATYQDLKNWTNRYDVDYPLVLDPSYKLGASMSQAAWPANYIVDPRTMRIVEAIAGSPDDEFWSTYESVMDGTYEPE